MRCLQTPRLENSGLIKQVNKEHRDPINLSQPSFMTGDVVLLAYTIGAYLECIDPDA